MYRDQFGEFACGYRGLKGKSSKKTFFLITDPNVQDVWES